jgi:4-hydroxythreonine-4-phosphate dehydrogenase
MNRPIIAITMGDAAGVGPEVIMKSLAHPELHEQCRALVVGDAGRLIEAGRVVGSRLAVRSLMPSEFNRAAYARDIVDCIDLKLIPRDLPWGKLSRVAGDGAFQYVKEACRLAVSGQVAAICTAQQGSLAFGRAQLPRAYGNAGGPDRHG